MTDGEIVEQCVEIVNKTDRLAINGLGMMEWQPEMIHVRFRKNLLICVWASKIAAINISPEKCISVHFKNFLETCKQ